MTRITYRRLFTRYNPERIEEEEVSETWEKLTNFCPHCGGNDVYEGEDSTFEDNCGNCILCLDCKRTYCIGGNGIYPEENVNRIVAAITGG